MLRLTNRNLNLHLPVWAWLLFILWLEVNVIELMNSWFSYSLEWLAETHGADWYAAATIQAAFAVIFGLYLIRQRLYGVLTAVIILMFALVYFYS